MENETRKLELKEIKKECERDYHIMKDIKFHDDHISYKKDYEKSYEGLQKTFITVTVALSITTIFLFGIIVGILFVIK